MKAFNLVADDEDLIPRLFKLFFDTISESHLATQIPEFMLQIMCDILEVAEDISQTILDSILIHFVADKNKSIDRNSPSYKLAKCILERSENVLQARLSKFIVQLLSTGKGLKIFKNNFFFNFKIKI